MNRNRGHDCNAGFSGRIQLEWDGTLSEDDIKDIFAATHCKASVICRSGIPYLTVAANINDICAATHSEAKLDHAIKLALEKIERCALDRVKLDRGRVQNKIDRQGKMPPKRDAALRPDAAEQDPGLRGGFARCRLRLLHRRHRRHRCSRCRRWRWCR